MAATELLKEFSVVIPVIAVIVIMITGLIVRNNEIKKRRTIYFIIWFFSILFTEVFFFCDALSFGLNGWDYLLGAFAGFAIGSIVIGLTYSNRIKRLLGMKTSSDLLIKDENDNSRILEPTVKMRERNKNKK